MRGGGGRRSRQDFRVRRYSSLRTLQLMLRILTFGGTSVAHPECELTGTVLQPRRLALLAVLSRGSERGVSRERLLSLFWPDDEEEHARNALTQAVYALRLDLGNDGTIVETQELRLDAELIPVMWASLRCR